jgi:hypothetical protein
MNEPSGLTRKAPLSEVFDGWCVIDSPQALSILSVFWAKPSSSG